MDRAITFDDINNIQQIIISFHHFKSEKVVPKHWHDFYELEVLISGSAKHLINGTEINIKEGDSFIITQNDFHSIKMLTDTVFFNISFNSAAISKTIINSISNRSGICGTISKNILCVLKDYLDTDFDKLRFNQTIKKDITELLAAEILKNSNVKGNLIPVSVNECVHFINCEFRNNISLSQISKKLYISPNHLGFIFKKSLGCSFRQYLNRVRLRYACGLLYGTEYSVKEIAVMSGFSSKEYFAFSFKSTFGISPAKWRSDALNHTGSLYSNN